MQFTSPTILIATEKLSPIAIYNLERYLLQNVKFPTCFAYKNEFSIFSNTKKMTPTKFQKTIIECLNSAYEVDAYKKNNNKNTIYVKHLPVAFLSYNNIYCNLHCKSIINYDSKPMFPYKKFDFTDNNINNDFNFQMIESFNFQMIQSFNFQMIQSFNDIFLKKEILCENTYQVNHMMDKYKLQKYIIKN
jgi:hypothetical protein